MTKRIKIGKNSYGRTETAMAYLLLLPALAAIAILIVYPMIEVIKMSLTNYTLTTGASKFIGIKNYRYLLSNSKFIRSVINTALFAAGRVFLGVTLSVTVALLLDCKIPARKFVRVAHFAPVVVPVVATAMIWRWFFDPGVGPLNQMLEIFGLRSKWIYDESSALFSILIFAVWSYFGYNVILVLSSLQGISDSYLEAAYLDGATELQLISRIKLPLIAPVISFTCLTEIINGFNTFTIVNILTPNGGPNYSTALVMNYVYDQAFTKGYMGRGCAASLVIFMMLLVFTVVQQYLSNRSSDE